MQSERFDATVAIAPANQVQARPGDERSRITQKAKPRRRFAQKPIFLGRRILKPASDSHVDRRDCRRSYREQPQQNCIFALEKRRFLVDRVLNLRVCNSCKGQADERGVKQP